ncbi:hypothetical protein [Blastopirellula marina]|uniref:Uncharacterized protein n=1 Tax=Blastopirellula marina TaxID=124 RepID=A0A2S8F5E8_9BACT|nr:hypothetical protein [Blastopirellula marina]PQO27154.1 hypothetical protein C5Y98_28320 [Blastopirellula marina]PTL41301.1 hypothetical protein C5Y97_28335 [Blastopirellula marina]
MPISFRCETCRRSIRVPDGSEGKLTRCPDCFSIVLIPFQPIGKVAKKPQEFAIPDEADDPLGITGKHVPRWEAAYPPNASSSEAPNNHNTVQAPQPAAPAPKPVNPFAEMSEETPSEELVPSYAEEISDDDIFRQERAERGGHILAVISIILIVLITVSLVLTLVGLVASFSATSNRTSPDLHWVAQLFGALTIPALQVGTLFGLNQARKRGNYVNAFVAMVLAAIPCVNLSGLLIVPLILPIWGMILLSRQEIKAMFQSNWEMRPE